MVSDICAVMPSTMTPCSDSARGRKDESTAVRAGGAPSAEEAREVQERSVLSRAAVGRRAAVLS